MLWGDGHQGAPVFNPLSYDHREHQFLKINVGPLEVTPEDHLRHMTGYWAWLAWALGEGPWVHYGQSNKNVRPNVPKGIGKKYHNHTDDWWSRRRTFLANRHKGNPPKGDA
jgi:hypothetical protein